ncbi:hypothetical protein KIN20_031526 [Parelaphostrongylus tenuis]|uniref:Rab-GAP TBC domain-containing protein n=1 Tax=Parelaphostrongylus tenuis TaxID=148309 RepID=A0AAD5WHA3_PARTN|nr:hypothetical protein KIN20_031526 [Parelaphostrongylus tenuis]
MSDYSYPNTGPRLVFFERHDSRGAEFNNRSSGPHESPSRVLSPEHRTQRSFSFQKKDEVLVNQILRRTSNSVAPITAEVLERIQPTEHLSRVNRTLREVNDVSYRDMPNSLLRYHDDDDRDAYVVSYDGIRYYDPVQETDIIADDVSEEMSDVYGPGTYNPSDHESTSSGEESDPELRELEERDNIVLNMRRCGPESKDIDPWENPEFDVYAKMDRFGFVHKDPREVTEEEQANRRRIAKEVKRENKWLAMEKSWKKGRLPQKLQERIWKGIPEKLRMKIWPRLLGAIDMRDARPNMYQELLIRALLVSKDIKQIDLDINRTYRDHLAFRRRYDVKQRSLMNVLAAYSMYNTEVGYCQGMSQIAALLLMYLDEEDTFWCIHALMVGKKHTMHGFFVPGFPKLSRFEAHFKKILKKYRPRVYKHLEKCDIPYIYLTKWWFGCFLDRVPFSLALRLWDVYLLEGDPILLAMALNIMKMHESGQRFLPILVILDDETMFSLREVLSKLKNDGLHVPPPPKADDLAEIPMKALGPILSRKISSIREEQEEIKSRRSHAASVTRSPYPQRNKNLCTQERLQLQLQDADLYALLGAAVHIKFHAIVIQETESRKTGVIQVEGGTLVILGANFRYEMSEAMASSFTHISAIYSLRTKSYHGVWLSFAFNFRIKREFSNSRDTRMSSSSLHETCQLVPNGRDVPLEIAPRRFISAGQQYNVQSSNAFDDSSANGQGYSRNTVDHNYGFGFIRPTSQQRTSWIRDERTGKMVTLVQSDDNDFDDLNSTQRRRVLNEKWRDPRPETDRVHQTSNNVTIITLGDDSIV